jgi:hypothetical protein
MNTLTTEQANKLIAVLETETKAEPLTLRKLIGDMLLFAEAQDVLTDLAKAAIEARAMLIENFKRAPKEWTWDKVKDEVKTLVDAAPIKDKVGALGALKTAFEYKILPVTLNADRLRKLKSWTDWTGKPVANSYGKVHTKPGAGQKSQTITNAIVPPAAPTPIANAIAGQIMDKPVVPDAVVVQNVDKPIPPVVTLPPAQKPATAQKPAGASAVPPSEVKPLTANVNGTDDLTPFEHWNGLFDQFMRHGVTAHYVKALGHVLKVDPNTLALAMGQARKDLTEQAAKLK